jgi:hypothetical protein
MMTRKVSRSPVTLKRTPPAQGIVWHVYIARGQNAASAEFVALTAREAARLASELWDNEPVENLTAHPVVECPSRGCNG